MSESWNDPDGRVIVGTRTVADCPQEILDGLDSFLENGGEIHFVHVESGYGDDIVPYCAEVMTFLGRDENDNTPIIITKEYEMTPDGWELENTHADYSSVNDWMKDPLGTLGHFTFDLSRTMIVVRRPTDVIEWTVERIMNEHPKIQVTLGGMITFDADILFGDEKYATIDSVAFSGSADWDTVIKCLNDSQPLHG